MSRDPSRWRGAGNIRDIPYYIVISVHRTWFFHFQLSPKKISAHVTVWMNLAEVTLSDTWQTQKDRYCRVPRLWGPWRPRILRDRKQTTGSQGLGEGMWGVVFGDRVSFWGSWNSSRDGQWGWPHSGVNALVPLNGALKNGNMVKCIPCVFYHNRKKIPCGKILLKQNKQKNKTKQKTKHNALSDTCLIKSMSILCFFQEIPSSHFRAACPLHPRPRSFGF